MFRNREDAARQLADRLRDRPLQDPIVLGIPRGGVVIGAVLARSLNADLDVVLARKLRAPGQPELALGAVGEDGEFYLNPEAGPVLAHLPRYVAEERRHQLAEIECRRQLFREGRPSTPVAGRSVIVTDDGVATGATMLAALHSAGAACPHEVIVAVPVGSPDRLAEVERHCDELVCLLQPRQFWAVGQFYHDFTQVTDEKVIELLREFPAAKAMQTAPAPGC